MAAVTICSNSAAPQNKVWHCFRCLPIYFPWSDGTRCSSVVNEAEVNVFLDLPCFLHDPLDVGNLTSGSSTSLKPSLHIQKFSIHIMLKSILKDFECNLVSRWDEYNWIVLWTFFVIVPLWDWNENWPFPVLWSLLYNCMFNNDYYNVELLKHAFKLVSHMCDQL